MQQDAIDQCSRVLQRRGKLLDNGTRLEEDELCPKDAVTDVIVTFNGNAYVVALCGEHKRHHDQAAADRRAKRRGEGRAAREAAATKRRIEYVTRHDGGSQ